MVAGSFLGLPPWACVLLAVGLLSLLVMGFALNRGFALLLVGFGGCSRWWGGFCSQSWLSGFGVGSVAGVSVLVVGGSVFVFVFCGKFFFFW